MNEVTQIIIWWTGAVGVMAFLAVLSVIGALVIHNAATNITRNTLRVVRLSTARYWVKRMEVEGLTVCTKEYRRLVAERNPKTIEDFEAAEMAANEKDIA